LLGRALQEPHNNNNNKYSNNNMQTFFSCCFFFCFWGVGYFCSERILGKMAASFVVVVAAAVTKIQNHQAKNDEQQKEKENDLKRGERAIGRGRGTVAICGLQCVPRFFGQNGYFLCYFIFFSRYVFITISLCYCCCCYFFGMCIVKC